MAGGWGSALFAARAARVVALMFLCCLACGGRTEAPEASAAAPPVPDPQPAPTSDSPPQGTCRVTVPETPSQSVPGWMEIATAVGPIAYAVDAAGDIHLAESRQ